MSNVNNEYYTSETSKILRQLVLSAIAVIWLFKKPSGENVLLEFKWPLILLIFTLLTDFLQYFFGSLFSLINDMPVMGEFNKTQEISLNILFYLKILCGFVAIVWMLCNLNNVV